MTPEARFDELLQTARADESILGLILYGSRAADMFVYEDSDWDVWLIVRVGAFADYEERYDSDHGDRSRSERTPSTACERIRPRNIARVEPVRIPSCQVLVDKLDGEIGAIVDRKRALPDDAAPAIAAAALDAYVNSTYRSLKAHRLAR